MPSPKVLRIVGIAALLVLVAVAAFSDLSGGSDTPDSLPAKPTSSSTGNWRVVLAVDFPLAARGDVATAWTERGLVVWGGDVEAANMGVAGPDRSYADGAVFDPVRKTWTSMSAAPLPANDQTPSAAAVRDGVVIARGSALALWLVATNAWTTLPSLSTSIGAVVANGEASVYALGANALLNVGTRVWQSLPPLPGGGTATRAAWVRDELFVFSTVRASADTAKLAAFRLGAAAVSWMPVADPGLDVDMDIVPFGGGIVGVDKNGKVRTYAVGSDVWTDRGPALPASRCCVAFGTGPRITVAAPSALYHSTDGLQ